MRRLQNRKRTVRAVAPERSSENGAALLIVLLVVAVLTVLVAEFAVSARMDYRLANQYRAGIQGRYLARSAVEIAVAGIRSTNNDFRDGRYKGATCGSKLHATIMANLPSALSPTLAATFGAVAGSTEEQSADEWCVTIPYFPTPGGAIGARITNERGKINVNALVQRVGADPPRYNVDRAVAEQVFWVLNETTPDMPLDDDALYDIVAAMIDWIDGDIDVHTDIGTGAEDRHYSSLLEPYAIKNGPLDTLDELLLVRGVTQDIFARAAPYLTVYPSDFAFGTTPSRYANHVDLNAAPRVVIAAAILGADADEQSWVVDDAYAVADCLISQRSPQSGELDESIPFIGLGALNRCRTEEGVPAKLPTKLTVLQKRHAGKPRFYTVEAYGNVGGVVTRTRAVVRKRSQGQDAETTLLYWREI